MVLCSSHRTDPVIFASESSCQNGSANWHDQERTALNELVVSTQATITEHSFSLPLRPQILQMASSTNVSYVGQWHASSSGNFTRSKSIRKASKATRIAGPCLQVILSYGRMIWSVDIWLAISILQAQNSHFHQLSTMTYVHRLSTQNYYFCVS